MASKQENEKSMESGISLEMVCLDCGRLKARNVEDVVAGKCPKWWAITDREAAKDCEAHAINELCPSEGCILPPNHPGDCCTTSDLAQLAVDRRELPIIEPYTIRMMDGKDLMRGLMQEARAQNSTVKNIKTGVSLIALAIVAGVGLIFALGLLLGRWIYGG